MVVEKGNIINLQATATLWYGKHSVGHCKHHVNHKLKTNVTQTMSAVSDEKYVMCISG